MKHLHMTLAVISITFFTVRFFWTLVGSAQLNKKWVKITPHVVDTFLLLTGAAMAFYLAINPLEYTWLLEKIIALVAYIFTGYYALKLARNNAMRVLGYVGAVGWFMLIARVAMTKQPIFF
ncbi:SirB2 family protein [Thalassotalea agarivorans]|uniref:Uncharacterized membrane protein SirB2 n=1 Tax=Thalassotalea agarivorans TaxID=349064 RepID=A0A1I0FEC3_THASX|nr:SirB2 family protein [Thalassotalea agarivorans]SET56462.1 Uncharacterized membrane protein SirB2 [Thalassotalea agarivorans]